MCRATPGGRGLLLGLPEDPVDLGDDTAGGQVFNQVQNFTINTPDADSFRRSKKEIAADMAATGQRALRQNR